jgi:hypothetical protein
MRQESTGTNCLQMLLALSPVNQVILGKWLGKCEVRRSEGVVEIIKNALK